MNGREFAALLGLVPRQHSTGGKSRVLGITKRGNSHVRTLLIHGARAVLGSLKLGRTPLGRGKEAQWVSDMMERKDYNKTSVGLANKMTRLVWSMVANETQYRQAACQVLTFNPTREDAEKRTMM